MSTKWKLAGVVSTGLAVLAAAAPANAGTVLDWNRHAAEALMNPLNPSPPVVPGAGYTPPVAAQHMAIVQLAVYDAVNSIDGTREPYLSGLPSAPATASQDAAAATAAHHVLVGFTPVALPSVVRSRLDNLYAATLGSIPDGPAETAGVAAGQAAAEAILTERTGDGRFVSFSFGTGEGIGQWRPTSTPPINDPFAWVALVRPFVIESSSQFRTEGPLPIAGEAYAAEYDEVKRLGARTGSERTEAQTALATFYVPSPVELFNRTFRAIAQTEGVGQTEQARLFAMLNTAAADSLITCWDDKAHWRFWRPVTAIHSGDVDGNPATAGNTAWTSLALDSPPYPEHPSGYNCATAGFMYAAQEFFGPHKLEFRINRTSAPGSVYRDYSRFPDVVKDTIDARIYAGIHFRAADEQGAWIGKKVAQWIGKHAFGPAG